MVVEQEMIETHTQVERNARKSVPPLSIYPGDAGKEIKCGEERGKKLLHVHTGRTKRPEICPAAKYLPRNVLEKPRKDGSLPPPMPFVG